MHLKISSAKWRPFCLGHNVLMIKLQGVSTKWHIYPYHFDGLVQDCSISSASAMEMLQSCTKPLTFFIRLWPETLGQYQINWDFVQSLHPHDIITKKDDSKMNRNKSNMQVNSVRWNIWGRKWMWISILLRSTMSLQWDNLEGCSKTDMDTGLLVDIFSGGPGVLNIWIFLRALFKFGSSVIEMHYKFFHFRGPPGPQVKF